MDKKTKRIIRMLMIVSVLAVLSICPVFADSTEILPTDVSTPAQGDVFLGLQGVFYGDEQAALDRINEIRYEACVEGVLNPTTKKALTVADYVPIKWSNGLEQGARWRAAESSLTRAHERTNGDAWSAVVYPTGATSYGEVLAWNGGSNSVNGINQFYEEKEDWVNQTAGAVTGHYTQMIDPKNKYVGIATFHGGVGRFKTTTAGEFSSTSASLDQTMLGEKEGIQLVSVKKSATSGEFSLNNDYSDKVFEVGDEVDYMMLTGATVGGYSYEGLIVCDATWSVSDSDILSCDNGHVSFNKCGEADVIASAGSFESDGEVPTATDTISREHDWETITDKEPTCTETGQTHEECTKCGESQKVTELPALGHTWEEVRTEPTCTEDGEKHDECTVCQATQNSEVLEALGHQWVNYTDSESTCTVQGETHDECSVCHETREGEKLPLKEHTWKEVRTEPTCTEDGEKHDECTVCHATQNSEVIKATGHQWEEVRTEPTCTEDGEKHDECTVCQATQNSEELEATGHQWEEVRTEPTCTEDGEKHDECTVCQATQNSEVLEATGHQWSSWKTTKSATALATGTKTRTCAECGEAENQIIAKLTPTIKLSATKKTIKKGKTAYITVSKLAKGDSIKSVKVKSKSIATVKKVKTGKYKITAKKKGTTTVTVILKSGKKANCKVTVKK